MAGIQLQAPLDRLRLLVDFAYGSGRSSSWQEVRRQLELTAKARGLPATTEETPARFHLGTGASLSGTLFQFHPKLAVLLTALATTPHIRAERLAQEDPTRPIHVSHFEVTLRAVSDGDRVDLKASAPTATDRLLYLAFLLVEEAGRDRLHVCARWPCGRVFVKMRKNARFCSERCQMRQYMTGYRASFTAARDYAPVRSGRRKPRRR